MFRFSDGSYMEDQDYWKYSGIERNVYVYARPHTRIKDFKLNADLVNEYKDGDFSLDAIVNSPVSGSNVKVRLLDNAGKEIFIAEEKLENEMIRLSASENNLKTYFHGMLRLQTYILWLLRHPMGKAIVWNHLPILSVSEM